MYRKFVFPCFNSCLSVIIRIVSNKRETENLRFLSFMVVGCGPTAKVEFAILKLLMIELQFQGEIPIRYFV